MSHDELGVGVDGDELVQEQRMPGVLQRLATGVVSLQELQQQFMKAQRGQVTGSVLKPVQVGGNVQVGFEDLRTERQLHCILAFAGAAGTSIVGARNLGSMLTAISR